MSLSNSLQTGVSGLGANSRRIGKISDNIANASTVGYKRSFADFVTTAASARNGTGAASSASVRAETSSTIDKQGSLQMTGVSTDLAIVGDGFFVVGADVSRSDALNFSLTRAGSFRKTADGFLRNSAGVFLYGFPCNEQGQLGVVDRNSFGDLRPINIEQIKTIGSATSQLSLGGNLPAQEGGTANSTPFASSFEFYDALGGAGRLSVSWTPGASESEWQFSVSLADGTALGACEVRFHDSGPLAGTPQSWFNASDLAAPPAAFSFDPASGTAILTLDNGTVPQEIAVSLGAPGSSSGITQFAGDYRVMKTGGDGAESGNLAAVEFGADGVVFGIFDNGQKRAVYYLPLAVVPNPNGLRQSDGNTYALTRSSGSLQLQQANGTAGSIAAGALERSNVDLAQELTEMIETQRSYTSNAKLITAVDEMLEETTRIVR